MSATTGTCTDRSRTINRDVSFGPATAPRSAQGEGHQSVLNCRSAGASPSGHCRYAGCTSTYVSTSIPTITVSLKPAAVAPTMSVEDACRCLKVVPGVQWEAVEQARRKAVQPSSPLLKDVSAEQQAKLLGAARHANAAYLVLASARIARY